MSEIDQQFIEYVVKSLVGKPESVEVKRSIDEKGVLLELTVDPEDLGRVIGKRGATAQSLRTLLRALGTKNDARYNLKIIDNGIQDHPSRQSEDRTQDSTPDKAPVEKVKEEEVKPEVTDVEKDVTPEAVEEVTATESASDRYAKSRAELKDLDDLDV